MNGTRHNFMASRVIFSKCLEMLKSRNRELKRTHNTFQDCRIHFLPTTFLEIAVHYFCIRPFSELPFAFLSNRLPGQTFSFENEFDLHENKLAGETQCHKNGFTRKLIFTLRQRELGNSLFSQETEKNE